MPNNSKQIQKCKTFEILSRNIVPFKTNTEIVYLTNQETSKRLNKTLKFKRIHSEMPIKLIQKCPTIPNISKTVKQFKTSQDLKKTVNLHDSNEACYSQEKKYSIKLRKILSLFLLGQSNIQPQKSAKKKFDAGRCYIASKLKHQRKKWKFRFAKGGKERVKVLASTDGKFPKKQVDGE